MPVATATPVLPVATTLPYLVDRSSHTSSRSMERLLLTDTRNSADLEPSRRFRSSDTALLWVLSLAFGLMWSKVGNVIQAAETRQNATKITAEMFLGDILSRSPSAAGQNHPPRRKFKKQIYFSICKQPGSAGPLESPMSNHRGCCASGCHSQPIRRQCSRC